MFRVPCDNSIPSMFGCTSRSLPEYRLYACNFLKPNFLTGFFFSKALHNESPTFIRMALRIFYRRKKSGFYQKLLIQKNKKNYLFCCESNMQDQGTSLTKTNISYNQNFSTKHGRSFMYCLTMVVD